MKEFLKNILKRLNIYHPLQSAYQNLLSKFLVNRYRIQYRKYSGNIFTCNFCGASYNKFAPSFPAKQDAEALSLNNVIAGYGENIICPNCLSTARERLVLAMLQSSVPVFGKKILHLSPEKKIFNYIKKHAQVTTADLAPGFYKVIDPGIQQQDLTQLQFEDACFDIIIGNHILEHIPDDQKAMTELFRVLKPGGHAVLQVPYSATNSSIIESPGIYSPALQSAKFGQKDHVRIYTLPGYIERLQSAGFIVEIFDEIKLHQLYRNAIQEKEVFLLISKSN